MSPNVVSSFLKQQKIGYLNLLLMIAVVNSNRNNYHKHSGYTEKPELAPDVRYLNVLSLKFKICLLLDFLLFVPF
jgi:hypothetical protein